MILLLIQLFPIHVKERIFQGAISRQHCRPIQLEIEFHFTRTSQHRLQRDSNGAQEPVLSLQNNLTLILMLIYLLVE